MYLEVAVGAGERRRPAPRLPRRGSLSLNKGGDVPADQGRPTCWVADRGRGGCQLCVDGVCRNKGCVCPTLIVRPAMAPAQNIRCGRRWHTRLIGRGIPRKHHFDQCARHDVERRPVARLRERYVPVGSDDHQRRGRRRRRRAAAVHRWGRRSNGRARVCDVSRRTGGRAGHATGCNRHRENHVDQSRLGTPERLLRAAAITLPEPASPLVFRYRLTHE